MASLLHSQHDEAAWVAGKFECGCKILKQSSNSLAFFVVLCCCVSNGKSYNYGTIPSQAPVRQMEHESTAEIYSLLLSKISRSWEVRLLGW